MTTKTAVSDGDFDDHITDWAQIQIYHNYRLGLIDDQLRSVRRVLEFFRVRVASAPGDDYAQFLLEENRRHVNMLEGWRVEVASYARTAEYEHMKQERDLGTATG